jgi:transcriptional regulator with XRE-family HTH domain
MVMTSINHPLILGQAIKSARKSAGFTQTQLAEAVGTYPRAIIELERGRSSADLQVILHVLSRLGIQLYVGAST